MALAAEQRQKILLLSDTVLYPEAVAFVRKLVQEEDRSPLPTSQVMGLLNIALASKYSELYQFVVHQRDRNWSGSKSDIKELYIALEKFLTQMKQKRIKDEFQLLRSGLTNRETSEEADELMVLLAREFIQHLVAENGLLTTHL